ncbi:MAG: hypothetical protein KY467_09715 [Gemmatimonadetes bacterium]|nr:hypothetical protein [Gemmatimonadota bacterium]
MVLPGTGIYTPADAATLLHERAETVRRWAFGYRRTRVSGPTVHPPLIQTDLPELEGQRALTFVELIELLYIRAFQRAGVPWRLIRQAANVAGRMYSTDHPFALRQLYADPHSVYGAVQEPDGSESLVQLVGHGQHAMWQMVKPYLEQLEFGGDNLAQRWWPMGRDAGVVVDPRFAFGAPIVEEVGIRTRTLAGAYRAELPAYGERAVERVAWTFEIDPRDVQSALGFERWLKAA